MKINFNNKLMLNLNKSIIQPKRSQIYVGFKCSQRCGFCYYKSRCTEQMFNLDYIKKQIDFEYDYGIRDFEITGGEPSEHSQLREICEYIKSKNENTRIAIISNGGIYKINVWDIIDEVLISYHSGKHPTDTTMFPNGSTYYKVSKSVDKAHSTNTLLRINTIIATFNSSYYDSIIDDIIKFQPNIINILPINLFDESNKLSAYINYDIIKPILKRTIDYIKQNINTCLVFIRYIPFCNMDGYEQHIIGNLQHIYDWFDWNAELCGLNILKYINLNIQPKYLGKYGSTSISAALNEINSLYNKSNKCLLCKYMPICDGVENNVSLQFCHPSPGDMIFDIMHFIKTTIQDKYMQYYSSKYTI